LNTASENRISYSGPLTPLMTVTPSPEAISNHLTELEAAMLKHMEYIVLEEKRPFCIVDFRPFEYDGQEYKPKNGTCRNKILKFKKLGLIEFQHLSTHAYYSVPGHKFTKEMTQNHAGALLNLGRQTPLYKWLKDRPREKHSLHDIRLTFIAKDIWTVLSPKFPTSIVESNMDLNLPPLQFSEDIIVKITVHHSHTVSVAIACPNRPFVLDIPDILYLIEILTRIETKIASLCGESVTIPRYTTWIAKMWHFGFDFLDRYDGEKYHVTFEEGISDLWRIYAKRRKGRKYKERAEHQECPNKPSIDAILEKLYLEGQII
jgi:hypothetical protein